MDKETALRYTDMYTDENYTAVYYYVYNEGKNLDSTELLNTKVLSHISMRMPNINFYPKNPDSLMPTLFPPSMHFYGYGFKMVSEYKGISLLPDTKREIKEVFYE